jgi:hypothetical protein
VPNLIDDRRKFQRVTLVRPLAGRIGAARVFILDASRSGFRVAHQGNIAAVGAECSISFEWEHHRVMAQCRITRNTMEKAGRNPEEKSVYHAGMEIIQASEESMRSIRDMIEALVARALDEQKANARGIPAVAAQTFQTGKGTQYLRYELINGAWRRTATTRADQPTNGFTISDEEAQSHIELLCETWASSNAEGRKLIRVLAELSISKAEGIPTRRYIP